MSPHEPSTEKNETPDFENLADQPSTGLLCEFLAFLADNKKWWLTPILLVFLLLGALIMLGGSFAAPFIYPLFYGSSIGVCVKLTGD